MIMSKKISHNFLAFAALKAKGVKQKDIAARCGVSSAAVSLVLNGKATSPKICEAVAKAVGIPVHDLFPQNENREES